MKKILILILLSVVTISSSSIGRKRVRVANDSCVNCNKKFGNYLELYLCPVSACRHALCGQCFDNYIGNGVPCPGCNEQWYDEHVVPDEMPARPFPYSDNVVARPVDLSNNGLFVLPDYLVDDEYSSLDTLLLENNNICELPSWFPELDVMKTLNLSNNSLSSRSLVILGAFKCIKTLYLGGNEITNLPEQFFNFTLMNLDLSNNPLSFKALKDIGKFHNLEVLNLENCEITMIPTEIFELQRLVKICLSENPLFFGYQEILTTHGFSCGFEDIWTRNYSKVPFV
ncbi:leucine-rich repeat domain-containing protein [Candidatus Babeliales bacterium]|nr:leucine-rich repeat domain-containing protein [Candidatus Babeliales bacterium]